MHVENLEPRVERQEKAKENKQVVEIIEYPHPTLRHESKPLRRVDAELRHIVSEMFDLMYEHQGVGLAANQVNLPYRLFVINLEGTPEAKDAEMVFINPVLSGAKGSEEEEEGCLSIPGVTGPVTRSEKIQLQAYNLEGEEFVGELSGLAARVVQHEIDHLNGTLFIDRLTSTAKMAVHEALDEFEIEFRSKRETGALPDDASIAARLAKLENLWT